MPTNDRNWTHSDCQNLNLMLLWEQSEQGYVVWESEQNALFRLET